MCVQYQPYISVIISHHYAQAILIDLTALAMRMKTKSRASTYQDIVLRVASQGTPGCFEAQTLNGSRFQGLKHGKLAVSDKYAVVLCCRDLPGGHDQIHACQGQMMVRSCEFPQ